MCAVDYGSRWERAERSHGNVEGGEGKETDMTINAKSRAMRRDRHGFGE